MSSATAAAPRLSVIATLSVHALQRALRVKARRPTFVERAMAPTDPDLVSVALCSNN